MPLRTERTIFQFSPPCRQTVILLPSMAAALMSGWSRIGKVVSASASESVMLVMKRYGR